ncbi:MAG: flagellar hook-length control protein FliK [Rhizobiaceae bacterium]|nr:flagellar hook-length control protein FliK [Rhizobiaceae bacterium]
MTLVTVPNFATPPHGGNASRGKQQISGGFRDALAEPGKDRHQRNVDVDARSASHKLIERLAVRIEDIETQALVSQEIPEAEVVADNPADTEETAVSRDGSAAKDGETDDADDAEAPGWVEMPKQRTPVFMHGEPWRDRRADDAISSPADNEATLPAGATDTLEAASGVDVQITTDAPQAKQTAEMPVVHARVSSATDEIASDPRTDTPQPKVNEARKPDTDIDKGSDAVADDGIRVDDDAVEIRIVSDSRVRSTGEAVRIQQLPYGSSVAMLNLMTQRETPAVVSPARRAAIIDTRDTLTLLPATDAVPVETATAETSDAGPAKLAPPASDVASMEDASRAGPQASGTDDDASPATPVDKASSRQAEAQILPARLGATAASVVETIVAHPAAKVQKLESQAVVDQQAGTATTHSLKIQLRPVELGEIAATLRMTGDRLSVEIATEKQEAYDRLNIDSDSIAKALRTLGLQVDQITVLPPQVATASAKADGGMSNTASGSNGQQFGQSGASAGGGSEGQRGTPSQGEQRNGAQSRQIASQGDEGARARGLFI